MIILHAGALEDRFLLWGEEPIEDEAASKARKGGKTKGARAEPYPFDAGFTGLSAALKGAGLHLKVRKRRIQSAITWIPTKGSNPLASSPLIAEPPKSRAETRLAPWVIDTLPLTSEETVELLCASMDRQMLAPGVVVGPDLAFWTKGLRFAGALVAKQQYLPSLGEKDGDYKAFWGPIFTGDDAARLVALAAAMPPISRALSGAEETSPPAVPAIPLLRWFITRMVDYLIRLTISEDPSSRQGGDGRSAFASTHDAWLYALQASDSTVVGDEIGLAQLAEQVRAWHRPIEISAASPFRLCFRLEEPKTTNKPGKEEADPSEERWYVRYLLQPYDDPSLLIPLENVWKSKGRKASWLKRYNADVQAYMLSSLGQAAGLCPRISASLETATPSGYSFDTTAAHEFLTEKAILLEQSGFGVMLPAWWTRKGIKTHLSVRVKVKSPAMRGGSGLSLENVVQFDWELALGDRKLTQRELETLAGLKAPLVRLRGQWVEVNAAEIQRAIDFWKNKVPVEARVRDIVQMALGAKDAPGGFDFGGVKATGWVGKLLRQLNGGATLNELKAPKAFSGTLRPYQVRGFSWLSFLRKWGLGACLADDMGLGKTIETLAMIQHDWERGIKRPVLLICPTSVVNNWQKEASRFTPELPVLVHHGADRMRGEAFAKQAQEHAIVVSSYGLLQRDIKSLQKVPWAGVVLDEAQNIKNPETKRAKAARAIRADYRIALTGTPVENNVGDLWSIMEFLNPGFLGTQTEFKRNFFIPIQAQRDPSATERLKRVTGPFILRRLKTDRSIIADLPDKMEMKVFCTLTDEQASLYAAVLKDVEEALDSVEGIDRKGLILATLSKLKQVCNHPVQFLGDKSRLPHRSGKLDRLTEMLEEIIEVGDRALVFSQFAEMGRLLKQHLQETFGCEIPFLHGGVSKRKRDQMIDRFQTEDGPPIFLLSLKAGGTGLNLTGANHVFHFDRWWNPAVENQATDRAFRIGQTKNVQVHKFICAGTLEEKIDEMIDRKKEVAETVVGTGEGWLTELSNAELKEIFALSKDTVG
jgi:SNF2 family DNA or RNA helicase